MGFVQGITGPFNISVRAFPSFQSADTVEFATDGTNGNSEFRTIVTTYPKGCGTYYSTATQSNGELQVSSVGNWAQLPFHVPAHVVVTVVSDVLVIADYTSFRSTDIRFTCLIFFRSSTKCWCFVTIAI